MPRSILLLLDVEPDARADIRDDPWAGARFAQSEIRALRRRLEEATAAPAHFNWFLRCDPQIEIAFGRPDFVRQACPDLLEYVERHGDVVGIHPHLWRYDARRQLWFNDFADVQWRAHCIQTSVAGYRSIYGRLPPASRCGDRFLSQDIVDQLRTAGVRYDLSIEPGAPSVPLYHDRHATAWLPDFRSAPRVPYVPARENYLLPVQPPPASPDFWMIPLTASRASYWRIYSKRPFLRREADAFNLVLRPRLLWSQLSAELSRAAADPVVLILRTGDLAQPRFRDAFRYVTSRVATHPALAVCRFTRVYDACPAKSDPSTYRSRAVPPMAKERRIDDYGTEQTQTPDAQRL